jgi:hypothetical protein
VLWNEDAFQIHYSRLTEYVKTELATEIQDPRHLVEIDSEVRTASFLTRDGRGHYGFAHKSYGEYFLARHLAGPLNKGDLECLRIKPLTPEVLTFLKDLIDPEQAEPFLEAHLKGEYRPQVTENALLTLYGIRRQSLLDRSLVEATEAANLVVELPDGMVLAGAQ